MAFGPESLILIDVNGNPLGTVTNPLFVSNTGVIPPAGTGNHNAPNAVLLVDVTGTPISNSNPLAITALN